MKASEYYKANAFNIPDNVSVIHLLFTFMNLFFFFAIRGSDFFLCIRIFSSMCLYVFYSLSLKYLLSLPFQPVQISIHLQKCTLSYSPARAIKAHGNPERYLCCLNYSTDLSPLI